MTQAVVTIIAFGVIALILLVCDDVSKDHPEEYDDSGIQIGPEE